MKMSKKRIPRRPKFSKWRWTIRLYDHGPRVKSLVELPRIGHPDYLYFVEDIQENRAWVKGKWIKPGMALMRIRPRTIPVSEIKVQPMASPEQLAKLISSRPVKFDWSKIGSDFDGDTSNV